jgi:23S rRNA pseudouridine1911/1915/1917 synthase
MRLEDHLLAHFPMVSKMYLREQVKLGRCEVNGRHENIGYRLRERDFIEIIVDDERGTAMRREDIELDILFEDNDLIVVVKPAGMLMHPSHREQSGTLLNALAYHVNREGEKGRRGEGEHSVSSSPFLPISPSSQRPGLPHRLDKQTSGLVIVAKNARAHRIISSQFLKKQVTKRYLALVDGVVEHDSGVIEAPIGRYDELKHWSVKSDGKNATTKYVVQDRLHGGSPHGSKGILLSSEKTLLELEPVTGRTNQLRIHCEHIGHPIVGDLQRGGSEHTRLCLHAYKLVFRHPTTGEMLEFVREVVFV